MGKWKAEYPDGTFTVLGEVSKGDIEYQIVIPDGGNLSQAERRRTGEIIGSIEIDGKYDVRQELLQIKRDHGIESEHKVNHDYFK